MNLIPVSTEHAHRVWPLLSQLHYDNLLDALIHGFHGELITDSLERPSVVLGWIGWNYYLAGNPESEVAADFIKKIPCNTEIHTTEAWVERIEAMYPTQFVRKTRYKHHSNDLDKAHLEAIVQTLPERYTITEINEKLYHKIMDEKWAIDFVGNFKDYEDFHKNGLGYVVLEGDQIVSGTSSYIRYNGGYEIEIITHEAYRNQGLAAIVGAYFALECLKRSKEPHWDAAHQGSVRLAKRIGFTFEKAYEVYIIQGNET